MAKPLNQTEVAELLGLTTRQIRNLEKEGLPKTAKGGKAGYNGPAVVQWFVAYREQLVAPKDLAEAEQRKAIADAQLAELKLAREQGKVVEVEVAADRVGRMLTQLRSQMLTLPQRWAPKVVGLKTLVAATTVLDEAVQECLTALSEGDG